MCLRCTLAALVACLVAAVPTTAQDLCPPDEVWAEVVGGTAVVHHDAAEFNCLPTMEFQLVQDGFDLDIYEIEVEAGAWCICCFDLSHALSGLAAGEYTVRVWGAYGCETTPCGSTVFTVPAAATATTAPTAPSMVSLMSDCGGWPLFADGFESGSTSAWDETVQGSAGR